MGVDYTAYAVIGVEIDPTKLTRPKVVPHDEHPVPPGARFCPECGAPATINVLELIEGYDDDADRDDQFYQEVTGYPLVRNDKTDVVGGLIAEVNDWKHTTRFVRLGDLERLKAEMQAKLEPMGLWDESKFGLYALLDVSV
jgi:hypothetical protein